ncbi:hypothetical protein AA0312_2188 [Acetobacter tropicalis NRIC 0312]|uniref:Membrane-bound lysozyme inhibitor of C-type lysozyme n=1 Tax=Acetobacter tropicalis TaxID=104102 RepID=A0A511FMW9_9PROT|nr:MliC family protein [Acetobacter tropicalis]KXV51253.1 hypothetical protein AD944_02480 [Acetobacter tropicalis]GAL99234.1 periplasmic protein-like protein [Acetobacter tropicalis]GBR71181.1 hypothetical protein AA0312_2188 [Acetobacter tropicalis NRIC 0312]GEL50281.1 membrane-bound lysozyme inhibitor of C-type lysozyme [Acetobacter tropicalis]
MQKAIWSWHAAVAGSVLSVMVMAMDAKAQDQIPPPQSSLHIPLAPAVSVQEQKTFYRCKGARDLRQKLPKGDFLVTYLNAGATSLAVLPVEGQTLVFTNVISGSGAKYVADRFVWWSKGTEAFFSEDRKDVTAQLLCKEVAPLHTGTDEPVR